MPLSCNDNSCNNWLVLLLCKSQKDVFSCKLSCHCKKQEYLAAKLAHFPWAVLFCLLASSSIFGRRVLFLAAKTGTTFHFFLLKVEWGAVFSPFRFWHEVINIASYTIVHFYGQFFSWWNSLSKNLSHLK